MTGSPFRGVTTDAPLPPHPDIGTVSPTPCQFTFSSVLDLDSPTPHTFSFATNIQGINTSPSTASTSTGTSPSLFGSSGSDQESNPLSHFHLPQLSSAETPIPRDRFYSRYRSPERKNGRSLDAKDEMRYRGSLQHRFHPSCTSIPTFACGALC